MTHLDALCTASHATQILEWRVTELGEVRRDPTHGARYRAILWVGVRDAWRAKQRAMRDLRAAQGETSALAA